MPTNPARKHEGALRKLALSYPEAREEFPWGERVVKVRNRIFLFLSAGSSGLHVTVKLPRSSTVALMLPFVEPTGYGLGKSGWVTARFKPKERPPLDVLGKWIDESYRAIAPKKLVAQLEPVSDHPLTGTKA